MKPPIDNIAHIAYHEAGHVVLNYYLGWKVKSFSIINNPVTNSDKSEDEEFTWVKNLTDYDNLSSDKKQLVISKHKDRILLAMAGEIAQCKFEGKEVRTLSQFPHYYSSIPESDIHTILAIKQLLQDKLAHSIHGGNLINECKSVINANWEIIVNLAERIIKSESKIIEQEEIEDILSKQLFVSRQ